MCGIYGHFGCYDECRSQKLSHMMQHRGPDECGTYKNDIGIICHERLSIVDVSHGKQPLKGCGEAYVVHNGEIYNHEQLRETELEDHTFHTHSDSEVIVHMYEEFGVDMCNKLDGIFAFIIIDHDKFMVARDPIGVKPLYYGKNKKGDMFFASEMKCIAEDCDAELLAFPPGHYYTKETGFVRFFSPSWLNVEKCNRELCLSHLRNSLEQAVHKRIARQVPMGILLSGGLDSSLIASIAMKYLELEGRSVRSFSIGLDAKSPDLMAARKVARMIGTEHHEVNFTIEEGIDYIEKLVWHLESYDVTTIRASVPMYILSKYIHSQDIKVILSGEGSDEILGGYLYFMNAPSNADFQQETIERTTRLSTADCLRADKSTMAFSLEARVPFLDKQFMQYAMELHPKYKRHDYDENCKMEKYILRAAFSKKESGVEYLPEDILWRQKEQFSDGVGYGWIEAIMKHCASMITNAEMAEAPKKFLVNTPETKEALYIRKVFERQFPNPLCVRTVIPWTPKWQMSRDPSGRHCTNHQKSTHAA